MKTPRIAGVGAPIVDLTLRVSEAELAGFTPRKGARLLAAPEEIDAMLAKLGRRPVMSRGGSIGNTLAALARLGCAVELFGSCGEDEWGRFFRAECARENVGTRFMAAAPGSTARCLALVTPDAERTMFAALGASAAMRGEADFSGFDHIYFESYIFGNPAAPGLFEAALASGARVSLDLSDAAVALAHRSEIARLLNGRLAAVFANRREAAAFCGGDDAPEKLAARLGERCPTAVVTLGADGCAVKTPSGKVFTAAAVPAVAADTTGAGDAFHAGFLYGMARGCGFERCARFGALLGAAAVEVAGAAIPAAAWERLETQITCEE